MGQLFKMDYSAVSQAAKKLNKDNPGDMPGVGGPVDVAVITADQGFVWVSRKKLRIEGKEINLD